MEVLAVYETGSSVDAKEEQNVGCKIIYQWMTLVKPLHFHQYKIPVVVVETTKSTCNALQFDDFEHNMCVY